MFLFVMKIQSFAEWQKCFHIDSEWHLVALTLTFALSSVSLFSIHLQLLRQLEDPDLLKLVLLFKRRADHTGAHEPCVVQATLTHSAALIEN